MATFPTDSGVRQLLDGACARAGVTPFVVLEHRSAAALLSFADHGLATAVLINEAVPRPLAARAARLSYGSERFEAELCVMWRQTATLITGAAALLDGLRDEAARRRLGRRRA